VSSQNPVTGLNTVPAQSSAQSHSVSSVHIILGTSIYA